MSERAELLESIAATIEDYREGEIDRPTPEHVDRWVSQFDAPVQIALLRELAHVIARTYFSRADVLQALTTFALDSSLVGADAGSFWTGTTVMDIQRRGRSQSELLPLFGEVLEANCGLSLSTCDGAREGRFVYIDDALFTGKRVQDDLIKWIHSDAPARATVRLLFMAVYELGKWQTEVRLANEATKAGKTITFDIRRCITIENRKTFSFTSEVLWPTEARKDGEVGDYIAEETQFPFQPRTAGGRGQYGIFSGEAGRQSLENEMLAKGVYIRSVCREPIRAMRPLGFSDYGVGFGSTIVTFRNCPNNAPLCLWWGDPSYPDTHPFSKWYPLFPRKTYEETATVDIDFDFDL